MRLRDILGGAGLALGFLGCSSRHSLEEEPRGPCGFTELETRADLEALAALQCVELYALSVHGDELESIDGLESVRRITTQLWIEGGKLRALDGLRNVEAVGDFVQIAAVPSLGTLQGLDGLRTVRSHISILDTSLVDLSALRGLQRTSALTISGNALLPTLGPLLDWPQGTVTERLDIGANPLLPACEVVAFHAKQGLVESVIAPGEECD